MTEYTESPEVIEVLPPDRTASWVHAHISYSDQFCSPDSPPSAVEDVEVGGLDSDENSSSSSRPPKMVLRYSDGQDVPISHWHYEDYPHRQPLYREPTSYSHSRPQTPHRYSHDRSRSVAGHRPSTPEDIKILPPDPNAKPQRVTGSYSARPRRSSEPYRAHPQSPRARDSDVYDTPPLRHLSTTLNVPAVTYSHSQRIQDPYDHHLGRSHSRGNRPHAPIVHAPGHNRSTDHYAPPRKPPGMGHIVPSPTGPQYPRVANVPHPRAHSYRGPVLEEQRHGPKGPRDIPRSHTPVSEAVSGETGNTYYILPSAGQKMKVLVSPNQLVALVHWLTSLYVAS
ncbi:hypothetical protein EDC04DRAFT_3073211 [Pisolithus marmoratus]|nr:hypothetical protein EDC04DRAFT_3073211 [Pisolithus marmoratus]